jgi:translocation and assembly module TamB
LVLRSDLNLRVQPGTNGVPELSGDIHLRNSLFLQNLQELLPGNLAKPSQRPPYFSVEAESVRDWGLDLKVRGERFLQMRNPLFVGELSTTLDVKGTLGEPVAVGSVRVNEGRVQFPFANLRVDQGLATLTAQNPYVPELLMSASGQNYGYRIRLEIEGKVNDPRILFSSSPPLRSEEIVLMMTAGEIPQDTSQHTGTQKTSRAAMFLGRDLLNRFSRDRETAERLTIRSGEYVTSQGQLTYYIEYKLNDRWSLVGEYDRFNALNAGLKWRLYSK